MWVSKRKQIVTLFEVFNSFQEKAGRSTLKMVARTPRLEMRIVRGSKLRSTLDRIGPTIRPVRSGVPHNLCILG
jgi:hypothetical protein